MLKSHMVADQVSSVASFFVMMSASWVRAFGQRCLTRVALLTCLQRRLAIGILASVGLGAFALVPTEQLVLKPSKPMYFYVVPLLRIKASWWHGLCTTAMHSRGHMAQSCWAAMCSSHGRTRACKAWKAYTLT